MWVVATSRGSNQQQQRQQYVEQDTRRKLLSQLYSKSTHNSKKRSIETWRLVDEMEITFAVHQFRPATTTKAQIQNEMK